MIKLIVYRENGMLNNPPNKENVILNKYSRSGFGVVEVLIEGGPTYKCNCCPSPTTSTILLSGSETNDSILNRLQTSLIDSEQIDYQEIMEMRCLEEENPK